MISLMKVSCPVLGVTLNIEPIIGFITCTELFTGALLSPKLILQDSLDDIGSLLEAMNESEESSTKFQSQKINTQSNVRVTTKKTLKKVCYNDLHKVG